MTKTVPPNISTTTSANAFTMESIEQMFHKMFQDNNSNQMKETTIKTHVLLNGTMRMVYLSFTADTMESHQIFATKKLQT